MQIIQPYNESTLQLIQTGEDYQFTSFGEMYVDSYFDLINTWDNDLIKVNGVDEIIDDGTGYPVENIPSTPRQRTNLWASRGVTDKESFGNIYHELYGNTTRRGYPYIKISVFSDINLFLADGLLQKDLDFYISNGQIFLKPNEYLDRKGFSENNYNLQFDFIQRFRENEFNLNDSFYISEISPSRKEIRIEVDENIYGDPLDNNLRNHVHYFLNEGDVSDAVEIFDNFSGYSKIDYNFNSFIELSQGRLIPINGYAFDNVTNNKRTLVLKLNQALPSGISNLTKKFFITNKFLSSQVEKIFFIDREKSSVSGLGLTIDETWGESSSESSLIDNQENLGEITQSVGEDTSNIIDRLKKDINLNIDYSNFSNHVFFGSAESKLKNFKDKMVRLDGLYTQLSSSLAYSSSNHVLSKRKNLFNSINKIKDNFTHYEQFAHDDGQSYSTASAPGIGKNLAGTNFSNNAGNAETVNYSFDGFDKVNVKSENADYLHLFTDVYNVENPPFYNTNDWVYLSFLLRSGDNSDVFTLNISGGLANTEYHSTAAEDSLGDYVYFKGRRVPYDAWSGSAELNSETTGSHYQRYIFRAQQNFFRPAGDLITEDGIGFIGTPGQHIYFAEDSPYYEILSGSDQILSSSLSGSSYAYPILNGDGHYVPYFFPTYQVLNEVGTEDQNPVTASLLPQGDLFPIFTPKSGDKTAYFTDVVVTKNDPTNIHPFSKIYRPPSGSYAGSSEWNSWYDGLIISASNYDSDNINSLVNNLPEVLRTSAEHKTLRDFVNMLGEQYDLLRNYIDNYENFYKLGYKNPNSIPDNLLPIFGTSLGFELFNPFSGSFQDYLEGTVGNEIGYKNVISSLWKSILNNIIYLYKTKGTNESLNVILNLFGFDTTSFNLTEHGGSLGDHNPNLVTNNISDLPLANGLRNVPEGNVSIRERTETLPLMGLSSGSNYLTLDWWSNDAEPNGLEFIFRTRHTNNTQTLVRSSGSNDNWDIRVVPSGSSISKGKIEFRLNNTENAGSVIGSNAISMSTDYIDNINDYKLFNLLLQRNNVTGSYSNFTQSYHMFIGRKNDDKITDIQFISMSSANSYTNQNYMTASGLTSDNLYLGEAMTGSLSDIRAWDSYISMSKFKQHIMNYNSTVGGRALSGVEDLVWRYELKENTTSTVFKDTSSPANVKNFDKTIGDFAVESEIVRISNFNFQIKQPDELKSDKQINLGSDLKSISQLSADYSTLIQPYDETPKQVVEPVLSKNYSYVDRLNDIIINMMPDFSLDDYLEDGVNDGVYSDLMDIRKKLITETRIAVDVPINLAAVENEFDSTIVDLIDKLTPAKTKVEFDYSIKNDLLFRSKIKNAVLQTQLNPNKAIGSASLTEPTLTSLLNQNVKNATIDVEGDAVTFTSHVNKNVKTAELSGHFPSFTNSNLNSNLATAVDIDFVDLSNSTNESVYNMELNEFVNVLFGSKNEFYKNHGKGSNQVHFIGPKLSANGDYNTSKYEDRFTFKTIGDIEEYFPITSSNAVRSGMLPPFQHHDNFRHFGNRYYVDSGSDYTYTSYFGENPTTVDGRMVGRTLFFSSSNGEIYYPINHYFKTGTSKDVLLNLIYKGTQYDGSNPSFHFEEDPIPSSSAYTINVGGSDTTRKLKVIR